MPIFGSSSGAQTEATETAGNGTQTETVQTFNTHSQTPQPPKTANASTQKNPQGKSKTKDSDTQTGNAQLFDMAMDDAIDAGMEDAEAAQEETRQN